MQLTETSSRHFQPHFCRLMIPQLCSRLRCFSTDRQKPTFWRWFYVKSGLLCCAVVKPMMMMMIYGEGDRMAGWKDGWMEQSARSARIHRRRRPRRPQDRADGRDRCLPPSPVTARPNRPMAGPTVWLVDTVRQVAACSDSGKLQAKMAMEAVSAVLGKRPAAWKPDRRANEGGRAVRHAAPCHAQRRVRIR